jgi:hypothetical protein
VDLFTQLSFRTGYPAGLSPSALGIGTPMGFRFEVLTLCGRRDIPHTAQPQRGPGWTPWGRSAAGKGGVLKHAYSSGVGAGSALLLRFFSVEGRSEPGSGLPRMMRLRSSALSQALIRLPRAVAVLARLSESRPSLSASSLNLIAQSYAAF